MKPKVLEDKNYLLIAPRISAHPYPANFVFAQSPNLPSVATGLAYISSSLKSLHKRIFNMNLEFCTGSVREEIASAIEKYDIDIVLTSGLCRHFSMIKEVVDAAKTAKSSIKIILGGGVLSSNPEIAMKAFEFVDIGVIGEGEYTILDLVNALNNGLELNSINGIIYKSGDNYIKTPIRSQIAKLDDLPLPDYEGLQYAKVLEHTGGLSIVCGRSCPFRCTFCSHPCGTTYYERSTDNIIGEMKLLMEQYGAKVFDLVGEGLFLSKKKAMLFCDALQPLNITWSCTMHATYCQPDILERMHECGCRSIGLGVESANDDILMGMRKKVKFAQIENALANIRKSNISIMANFIFGDEFDTQETIDRNFEWWRQHRMYPLDLLIIYVYPGTELYKRAVADGKIKDEVQHLKNNCTPINVSQLTEPQYDNLYFRISTEKAFYTYAPPMYEILENDFAQRRTHLNYVCECGYESTVWIRGILISDTIMCPKCRRTYTIPFHENYSVDISLVERKHGKKIAYWGIGVEMQLLLEKLGIATCSDIMLVDKDTRKQGLNFREHAIQAPEILSSKNISAVVVTPIAKGASSDLLDAEIMSYGVSEIVSFESLLSPPKKDRVLRVESLV